MAFVQGNAANSTSATSLTCAFPANVTAGNLIVVDVVGIVPSQATWTVTDSQGNTYTNPTAANASNSVIPAVAQTWYAKAKTTGACTVTFGGISSDNVRICIHEYSGVDTFDVGVGASGNTNLLTATTPVTSQASELVHAWGVSNNGVTSAGSGFTLRETAASESTEDKTVAAAGAQTATFPQSAVNEWLIVVTTFYSSGGGGTSVTGSAALAAAGSLTVAGKVAHTGTASLTATASLSASGSVGVPPVTGSASLAATASLTAAGSVIGATPVDQGAANLAAAASLTVAGVVKRTASANLTASGSLTVSASVTSGSVFVSDSFTDTAGTALTSHIGETGATWVKHPNFTSGAAVIGSAGDVYSTSANSTFDLASGIPNSPDYTVACDLDFLTKLSTSASYGVVARYDPSASTGYEAAWSGLGGQWQLIKHVAGSNVALQTNTVTLPTGVHRFELEVAGSTITAYADGVVVLGPITDTDITAAGRAGIRLSGVASDSTGVHIDNFAATNSSAGVSVTGAASLAATASLTASSTVEHAALVSFSTGASLVVSGSVKRTGSVTLSATASLTAAGAVSTAFTAGAALYATASLIASGSVAHTAAVGLSATASLVASGHVAGTGTAPTIWLPVAATMRGHTTTGALRSHSPSATMRGHTTTGVLDG